MKAKSPIMPLAVAAILTASGACGGGAGSAPDGGTGGAGGSSTGAGGAEPMPPPGDRRGEIRVSEGRNFYLDDQTLVTTPASRLEARFFQGTEPSWHTVTMTEGACILKVHTPQQCDDYCEGVCTGRNQCTPYPPWVSAGTLTFAGLTVAASFGPMDSNGYYYRSPLPDDLFDSAAAVTVTASGAAIPTFSVQSQGVPPLVVNFTGGFITLTPATDHVLRWTPASPGSRVHLTINSRNLGHGMPYLAIVECDAPDAAGQLTVPKAIVDALPEITPLSICVHIDCPPSSLRRYRRSFAELPSGYVELQVSDEMFIGVDHRP